jgi:hypothetical protein
VLAESLLGLSSAENLLALSPMSAGIDQEFLLAGSSLGLGLVVIVM